MKKICLVLLFCFGCTSQPFAIQPYPAQKTIIRTFVSQEAEEQMETREDLSYPDPTKGYIENKAYPYVPKIWMIMNGKKTILIGPAEGPPWFWEGEIREFNFTPGLYVLHIERWRKMPSGWEKMKKTEVVKLKIAQTEEQLGLVEHYGWRLIINKTSTSVY